MYTSDTDRNLTIEAGRAADEGVIHINGSGDGTSRISSSGEGLARVRSGADASSNLKTGMRYLWASLVIAAAAAVYGLFSHGVYSYWMTYAFMIPLLLGAMPHLICAMRNAGGEEPAQAAPAKKSSPLKAALTNLTAGNAQLAAIAALTTGSLMKGALEIYGTTSRLLIIYPALAGLVLIAMAVRTAYQRSARMASSDTMPTRIPAAMPLNKRTGK